MHLLKIITTKNFSGTLLTNETCEFYSQHGMRWEGYEKKFHPGNHILGYDLVCLDLTIDLSGREEMPDTLYYHRLIKDFFLKTDSNDMIQTFWHDMDAFEECFGPDD